MQELETVRSRLQSRLLQSDVTPTDVDWFRYRGYDMALRLIKNLAFEDYDSAEQTEETENLIVRHSDLKDAPTDAMEE